MQILSQLGLMFRANMLRQLSAKVELARTHYSPSRFTAALIGINNREQQLAERFSRGHLSLEKLQRQAARLASHEVLLNARRTPEADRDVSPARRPVQTATAFRSVLLRAYCRSDGAAREKVATLLAPDTVRARARTMLADAVWKGHLVTVGELAAQVRLQAHHEALDAGCAPDQLPHIERDAMRQILAFVGASHRHAAASEASPYVHQLLQATVDALRLRSETPPQAAADFQVPPSWERITDAFWRPGAAPPAYAAFSAAVAAAVDDALPPGLADATLPEQRCRRTFELLQYLRHHAPPASRPGDAEARALLERHAQRLEGEAVDVLIKANDKAAHAFRRSASSGSSDA
ncbi:hypothetical protein [Stenotrophomonas sp. SORGH_AS_0321]|uniref:hypothetical protein n=1 Tax=Stenotrophomonas sp. SORGH_AS_0321 TaxID=3041787 RepID=UPI002863164D|nr:hypothetical protein [Stenotrophomonas sp. SORGH_AS_0321]MDR6095820.1 hypothetical protein [Stenotrophomonas sp. SORGH_AS_0321]